MKDNKTFCILPWIHTHLNTEGDVFPCCVSWNPERTSRVGWLKDNSLEELFNNDFMKQLRLDMLAGKERPDVCSNCYDREKGGFRSARQGYNLDHEKDLEVVENTASDGYVEPKIKSWDIRFSNLCNLKCRTCGPLFSTTWAQERNDEDYVKIKAIKDETVDPLEKQYEHVEKLYFAGGEPLIMPEHFKTLKKIIAQGRAKEIQIIYNSNLTKLDYNNNDLVSLWKEFKEVVIGASIDAVGSRAEYIRNGIPWKTIESNLDRLMQFKKECPTFDFYYSPTVGILNVAHITDMHKYLYDNKLITHIDAFNFNLLLYPLHYDMRILPNNIKDEIVQKIKIHETWLSSINAPVSTIDKFVSLRNYLVQDVDNAEQQLNELQRVTTRLDKVRNEDFATALPEYKTLWEKI
jgi:organic radical activating enzyme